jgi:tRNA pseudouridine55 synthase
VNGLLIVDKPGGITSHDVIKQLRRAIGEPSMGHLGTLDPMATGVLPILMGRYTRLAQFFGPMVKSYTGTIRFGFATDTYDAEGKPCSPPQDVSLTREEVEACARHFLGAIEQIPPPYSAKKVAGSPAYAAARRGEPVVLNAVPVLIEEFSIGCMEASEVEFAMRISSGGYVRSVAHELGARLGCGAHLARLRRVAAGAFTLDQASALEELCSRAAAGDLEQTLPHPRTLLPELPSTTADPWSAGRVRNGNPVNLPEFSQAPLVKVFQGQRELVAIARRIAGTLFQPVTVIG